MLLWFQTHCKLPEKTTSIFRFIIYICYWKPKPLSSVIFNKHRCIMTKDISKNKFILVTYFYINIINPIISCSRIIIFTVFFRQNSSPAPHLATPQHTVPRKPRRSKMWWFRQNSTLIRRRKPGVCSSYFVEFSQQEFVWNRQEYLENDVDFW